MSQPASPANAQASSYDDASPRAGNPPPPPQLHQLVADNETLQPSAQQLETALQQSRSYWTRLAAVAGHLQQHGLYPESVNPGRMLGRVPRMRGRPQTTYAHYMGASPSPILCFPASAHWRLNGPADCGIPTDKTSPVLLHLGTKAAVPCSFDGGSFRQWIGAGAEGESAAGKNCLGLLTLGWCYILSAALVELQGDGASLRYTGSKAMECCEDSAATVVDIGEANEEVSRWWSALLAPGEGWKAVVQRSADGEFLAPWSVAYVGAPRRYCIAWGRNAALRSPPSPTPLSSRQAFAALAQFALLHNTGSQFLVALATAITVPAHNWHGSAMRLPPPTSTHPGARCPTATATAPAAQTIPQEWATLHEHLPYYMTLSCNPEAIMSSLCGTFWQTDVPCTLASPWLHPILHEARAGYEPSQYAEILALVGGLRRPSISALWLGAAAGGLVPMVVRRVRRGRPPLDPLAFPWTGCPLSFMECPLRGSYADAKPTVWVWRADVWRLLHLPVGEEDGMSYRYPPHTPWEPCGRMRVRDCALRVVAHLGCASHEFRYSSWSWEIEGGVVVNDPGFSVVELSGHGLSGVDSCSVVDSGLFPHKPLDQEASQEASFEVFRWFVGNGEGVPAERIYQDEWLEGLDDDVDSEEAVAEDEGGSSC